MDILEQLRDWCNNIRRNPSPISDAVPMVQKAADEMERLRAELAASQAREKQLREGIEHVLTATTLEGAKAGYQLLQRYPHDDTALRLYVEQEIRAMGDE